MAITPKGFKLLIIGVLVMIAGYVLMMGGNSGDPKVSATIYLIFSALSRLLLLSSPA